MAVDPTNWENQGANDPSSQSPYPTSEPKPESFMEMTDDVRELLKENQRRERHA